MINSKDIFYFDNNASTPIDKRVLEKMLPFFTENFANPSSTHHFGHTINESVKIARSQVGNLIGADENEIIFTSGSTEAINIAIKGVAENYSSRGKHIVTVTTEHHAVIDTCKYLETNGYEVTYLSVDNSGLIDLDELKTVLRTDTILVCVMYVNNETGVIQPLKQIASLTHEIGALFMTDATQAVGKINIDVDNLDIDLLCLSGHKIYAAKGIGALYIRQNNRLVKLSTYTHGGGHEKGFRSGTLNVPGIVALGVACQIAEEQMVQDFERVSLLRDELERELLKISETYINGDTKNRIYNVTNICFKGCDANVMIGMMRNVAVSNGSACTSAIIEPSHVLTSMGLSNDDAFASLRFSLGRFNTQNEVKEVVKIIWGLTQSNFRYA